MSCQNRAVMDMCVPWVHAAVSMWRNLHSWQPCTAKPAREPGQSGSPCARRYVAQVIAESTRPGAARAPFYSFLERCLRHKAEMVIFEAARAIVAMPRGDARASWRPRSPCCSCSSRPPSPCCALPPCARSTRRAHLLCPISKADCMHACMLWGCHACMGSPGRHPCWQSARRGSHLLPEMQPALRGTQRAASARTQSGLQLCAGMRAAAGGLR